MSYEDLWSPMKIEHDQTLLIQLGTLDLWIHRGAQEWYVASECHPELPYRLSVSRTDEMPDCDWTRWVINDPVDEVILNPRLPDRPLIVRPEMPVCLLPNQSVQFYIGVPIWMGISLGGRIGKIVEIPSLTLSNSWFGPTTEGTLCYAMRTTAKLRQEDLQLHPHRAVVPFEIRNMSDERLDFERLCLHTTNLRIYQGRERMWTNRGRVSYRGAEKWSRVVYARGVPPNDHAERLIGKARDPGDRGAVLKTFGDWKNLADF